MRQGSQNVARDDGHRPGVRRKGQLLIVIPLGTMCMSDELIFISVSD